MKPVKLWLGSNTGRLPLTPHDRGHASFVLPQDRDNLLFGNFPCTKGNKSDAIQRKVSALSA